MKKQFGGNNYGTFEKLFCVNRNDNRNSDDVLRLGFPRNSEQNNGMVRLIKPVEPNFRVSRNITASF